MFKLICISVLVASIIGTPIEPVAVANEDLSALYRLSGEVIPTLYDVILFLNPDDESGFRGSVEIRVLPQVNNVNEIVLHAMEMDIHNLSVVSQMDTSLNIVQSHTLANDDTHFLRIALNREMIPFAPYVINIDYTGRFAANMFGIYLSTYTVEGQTRRLITSQLQPTFARRAFPCFDEPYLKAIFRTTIYAPEQYGTVRSNMPLRTDTTKPEEEGYIKHEFEDTLVMSSYLIAYLVSDFNYIENQADDIYHIPFRIYSRPNTQDTAEFALEFGQKNMYALENYIDFSYYFPKLDKVAVPDFAAGAMENWGLVIYREVALLVRDGITSTSALQNIGRIITHENIHMWFGNEVSPMSWTYTWLNEGFANFFENYGTDMVHPEWRMMDQFVIMLQNVFQSDAVLSVNPMTHPVYTPSQILGTFNAVAYQKSGSVIRMMQHFLTPEVYQKGLSAYIRKHSRGAVTPVELFADLQAAVDESEQTLPAPLSDIMNRWSTQGGFPVLTVRRSAPTGSSVFVEQERYLTDRGLTSTDRWHVPVNWVLSTNPNFEDTSPQSWIPPEFRAVAIDIEGLREADWFIFNKQQTGYYRVNYDRPNWIALTRALNNSMESINLLNRAQLVDDVFNLARNGRIDYAVTFELARYLIHEPDYIPWAAANAAFGYLDNVLSASSVYHLFQRFLLQLSNPLYKSLGFTPGPNDEFVTAYHRNIILNINCRNGNEECVSTAQEMLNNFRENGVTLNPDIQTTVYCSGLRGGDVPNFDFLWNMYVRSTDSSEQSILLNALGCTTNEEKRDFYLNQVIAVDSEVREQDRHTVIVSVINASPENREVALTFTVENFDQIQPRVQGLTGTTNILNAFSRTLTTQAHLETIYDFRQRYSGILTAGELASINAIQENIAASLTWTNEYYSAVDHWLRTNGSTATTASFALLLTIIAAIFNL